jgi:WS/DGAT/MGAT family acyltransferase
MAPSDAVLWDIERDPLLRSTIVGVSILDRAPSWERLVARMERVSRLLPRLRERVVEAPLGIGPPRWVVDEDFDLAYHLRRARCPAPGDLRALLDLAQPAAMADFDRFRPLWEFTLVEGLADGRAALIQKIHHSLTDGMGGVELALLILDDRPDAIEPEMPDVPVPRSASTTIDLAMYATGERASLVAGMVRGLPNFARDTLPRLGELAPSIGRMLRPVANPASPLMRGRSLTRRLHAFEVPLDGLRAAGRTVGGTANDAYLAAVIGGLTRYHAHHAVAVDELRITMPINFRSEGDDMVGNRFTPARFAVPADIDDPSERMRVLGRLARAERDEPANDFTDALAGVLGALPGPVTTAVLGGMLRNIDLVCTNVPGIPQRSWFAGAEMLRWYAFAPAGGSALSVALLSFLRTACIGVVTDSAAVPDPDVLAEALTKEFHAVLALGEGTD